MIVDKNNISLKLWTANNDDFIILDLSLQGFYTFISRV